MEGILERFFWYNCCNGAKPQTSRMKYITTKDAATGEKVQLSYTDYGSGRPVVLLHGWSLSREMWEYQLPDLVNGGLRCVLCCEGLVTAGATCPQRAVSPASHAVAGQLVTPQLTWRALAVASGSAACGW